jgi:hypothetical protein
MPEREETFSGRRGLGNGNANISVQGRALGESWASGNLGKGSDWYQDTHTWHACGGTEEA